MAQGKILIADDSPTIRNMLSTILKKEGYDVVVACDGIEAINAVYSESPDVILLDIFMPRMNGYQVCRLLKDDKKTLDIPVLMLTGSEGKAEKFWSLETGADKFMVKDIDTPEAIIEVVKTYASGYRKRKKVSGKTRISLSEPVEILSKVSALLDKQLYQSTLEKIKLKTIVTNLAEGLVTVDAERIISLFNPAMEGMTGLTSKDVLGKHCCDVFKDSLCKETCHFEDVFAQGEDSIDIEFEIISKAKQKFSVLNSISLLRNDEGKLAGAVCVFKDITNIRSTERMKANFVSMVTHELRSPLTIIKASVNNMLQGLTGDITSQQKECLDIARHTSERLLGLVSDLLDLSKIESGSHQLNFEPVDINDVLRRCLADFELLIKQKRLTISLSVAKDLPKIPADFNKIEQVLINLISNAIKFTHAKGKITIEVKDRLKFIECSVSDTGKGIAKDAQEKIFDKFQQIYDKQSRQRGGTGLGLSVVKAIVQAHNGKVWVESNPGGGSKFIFIIPKKILK